MKPLCPTCRQPLRSQLATCRACLKAELDHEMAHVRSEDE